MKTLVIFACAALALPIAFCAPTSAYAAALLRQNALDAQILNVEFQHIKDTDPCDSGQIACVGGSKATCRFGSWQLSDCDAATQCFALPMESGNGIFLDCRSDSDAESVFKSAGVYGGPSNDNATAAVAFPTSSPAQSIQSNSASSAPMSTPPSSADEVAVVTVTVTVPPVSFSTSLPLQVTTVRPDEARSIIASLVAGGATIINAESGASSAVTATAQVSPSDNAAVSSVPLSQTSPTASCTMIASSSSFNSATSTYLPPDQVRRTSNLRRATPRHT